ncbi:MAG: hypothetical protein D6804_06555 [Aquificota bacterium]|nr:MAG: hypothetical protein D6804_06555 [Aquificota bacterium]
MPIDRDKIKQAIRLFLEGIGEDPDREGLKETPDRIARMWEEFEGQRSFDFKLFEEFGSYNEMVLVKDITIYSLCEHHLLPFFGKAHIAYIPDGILDATRVAFHKAEPIAAFLSLSRLQRPVWARSYVGTWGAEPALLLLR